MKTAKKTQLPPVFWLMLGGVIIFLAFPSKNILKDPHFSIGNKLLIKENVTDDKKEGVASFEKGNYKEAMISFEKSLKIHSNDPETLINLNNAKAQARKDNIIRIAVVVPIGSNLNIAQEMLRGVAQAQNEVNNNGGINGQFLQVLIVNDENKSELAQEVAKKLVQDQSILAVVGHNASNASVVAAPIYQKGELVMITPTSFSNQLSGIGDYIFRTVPNIRFMAESLANYVFSTAHKHNLAVCYDSNAPDNMSLKNEFTAAYVALGGEVNSTVCNFSAHDFDAEKIMTEIISSGADSILLSPHVDRIEKGMEIARANDGKLSLFGSPTLYTMTTLQSGGNDVKGLILSVPWHPQLASAKEFVTQSSQLWGGQVSWRTATAYDSTKAIIQGLKQSGSREKLQEALKQENFSVQGANGVMKFLPTGDRLGQGILVRVQSTLSGYEFVSIN